LIDEEGPGKICDTKPTSGFVLIFLRKRSMDKIPSRHFQKYQGKLKPEPADYMNASNPKLTL